MRRIVKVSLVVVALALSAAIPANATVRPGHFKLQLAGEAAPMHAGRPWTGEVEIVPAPGVSLETLGDIELEGEGWRVRPLSPAFSGRRFEPGRPMRLRLDVEVANPSRPLVLRYTLAGQEHERPFSMRALDPTRPARRLERVELDPSQLPLLPNPEAFPKPGLPHDRRSRDAEGLERGAIGDSVISDGPERTASSLGATPAGVQGKNIRVRGQLVYQFNGQNVFGGADAVMVQIYDEDTGTDELLWEGLTDVNGNFDVTINWDPCLGCDATPDLYVYFETDNDHVNTQTSGIVEADYSWETSTSNDYTGNDLNIGQWRPLNDAESDGALYAHTMISREWRWFSQNGWSMHQVDVQCWEDGGGAVSYYEPFLEEIHLIPQRMFFSPTMFHEYGHHWMSHYAQDPAPNYCNGICDTPNCGHCAWCAEPGAVPWTEGFAEFIERFMFDVVSTTYSSPPLAPLGSRDYEFVAVCDSTGVVDNGFATEGLFAAAVYDLVDANQDDDTSIPAPGASDRLNYAPVMIFNIAQFNQPASVWQFFNALRDWRPDDIEKIWATAYNGGVNLDAAGPGVPTNLHSFSHPDNTPSADATVWVLWDRPTDDWAGVDAYSVLVTMNAPTLPDTTAEVGEIPSFTTSALLPGTYYVNVRARDRAGRWGDWFGSYGPVTIRAPEPADLAFPAQAGWDYPLVPRPAADGQQNSVPAPTSLIGNAPATWWNLRGQNVGEAATASGFRANLHLDGDSTAAWSWGVLNAYLDFLTNNRGPITVRGGRHTLTALIDAGEVLAEPVEGDNVVGRQWIWSPLPLAASTTVVRPAPPDPFGGWDEVTVDDPLHYNVDGLRFTSSGWWNALWIAPVSNAEDYDLRLHFATSSVDTGFGAHRGNATRNAGELDAVLVNRNTVGELDWDAGVVNYSLGAADYYVRHVVSQDHPFGDSLEVGFPINEYLALRQVWIGPGQTGPLSVWVRAAPGSPPVTVLWLDRTFATGDLEDFTAQGVTDGSGAVRLDLDVPVAGYYGVVVHREPKDGYVALPFTLEVGKQPPDLATFQPASWYAPLIPRADYNPVPGTVALPDTLHGNMPATYLYVASQNLGLSAAAPNVSRIEADGESLLVIAYGSFPAGLNNRYADPTPTTVRGGRHTLAWTLDQPGAIEELSETNNTWGEQWVWSPLPLADNTPVARPAPPDRTLGWAQVTSGQPLYLNCDGLRTPAWQPAGRDFYWGAVAVMPHGINDVDLRLHEPVPGTQNGFRALLAASAWGTGLSDYVLVNFNSTAFRAFDAGVIRYSGTEDYSAEVTASRFRVPDAQGGIGPFTLPSQRIADVHEIFLDAGTWTLVLENQAGQADLGLSVHGAAPYHRKSSALASAWEGAAGGNEALTVTAPGPGYYAIVVWKAGAADLPKEATYRVLVTAGVALAVGDAETHTGLALANPYPNPSRGDAVMLAFTLPDETEVELELYDVTGARVRTLARGARSAGRHSLAWDGRDHGGRPVPAGVYYARLKAGPHVERRKLVRLP